MIIETKYRDIPWEEARQCLTEAGLNHGVGAAQWEPELRGKPVVIETPPVEPNRYVQCGGPFFLVFGAVRIVCPHIAEIGD